MVLIYHRERIQVLTIMLLRQSDASDFGQLYILKLTYVMKEE